MIESALNDIISTMTEEEKETHKDMIKECLERESNIQETSQITKNSIKKLSEISIRIEKNIEEINILLKKQIEKKYENNNVTLH